MNRKRNRVSVCEPLEVRCVLSAAAVSAEPAAHPGRREPVAAHSAAQLRMTVRDSYLPDVPVLVQVQLEQESGQIDRDRWNAVAQLVSDNPQVTISPAEVQLVNGVGSVLVTVDGVDPFTLSAQLDDLLDQRSLVSAAQQPVTTVSGSLTGDATEWSGVVRITGDVNVPADHVLSIAPGTLVLLDGQPQAPELQLGTRVVVNGTLNAAGTEELPITFTANDPNRPWGEIDVAGGTATFHYAQISRAGNSPRGGHTGTGPALRMSDSATVELDHSAVTDISGKILQSEGGSLEVGHSLLSRAVMGPEIVDTGLDFHDSWIIEMAGVYHHNGTVNDNDGIYLHEQAAGQTIALQRSVIANVQDDGIDTLGSTITVDEMVVRDTNDKSISVFHGDVTVRRSLLVRSEVGIEAKGTGDSTAEVHVDQTTIADVEHAIRAFDKDSPDPDVRITYDIRNSILHVLPGGDPLYTDYDPADLHVNYAWTEEDWSHAGSGEGLVRGQPLFVDSQSGDYRLAEGSPAIDAGDPAAPLDADGTVSDLGYRPAVGPSPTNPDFNRDGALNADDIDLLCAALAAPESDPQFDLDQNGSLSPADVEYLVVELLHSTYGDANLDGRFDSSDLVLVFALGEYEDDVSGNSGWAAGDWNCDGDFTTSDLVTAFAAGQYEAAGRAKRQVTAVVR